MPPLQCMVCRHTMTLHLAITRNLLSASSGLRVQMPQCVSARQMVAGYRTQPAGAQSPQVQGVLSSAVAQWPHIHISDSLVMADAAVKMARAGCTSIAVLGVDFMSENVRAILDDGGFQHVQVWAAAKLGTTATRHRQRDIHV